MPRKRNEPLPPPPDLPPSAWATPAEAAALRRTSISTLWDHVKRGVIPPPVYFGPRSPRWRVADVTAPARRREAA
jgi:predicted DNA-binding transcriptional regulator AlpA